MHVGLVLLLLVKISFVDAKVGPVLSLLLLDCLLVLVQLVNLSILISFQLFKLFELLV